MVGATDFTDVGAARCVVQPVRASDRYMTTTDVTRETMRERPSAAALKAASVALEGKSPAEILRWAAAEYQPGLTLACSFGGPSGMVLLDMIMQIDKSVEVFYLDTDF